MRAALALAFGVALLARGTPASAQQTPAAPGPPAPLTPAAPPALPTPAEGETPQAPPPVVVAVVGDARCPEPVVAAFRDATFTTVRAMVRGRETTALDPARTAIVATCAEPSCIGAQIADAGGIQGVLVRLSRRRPRDPIAVHIEVLDPVSGNPRGAPLDGVVPVEAELAPSAALAPLLASLAERMPAPPPVTTLLLAISEDGATVRLDGQETGESPLAPLPIEPGVHTLQVVRNGFRPFNHRFEVREGTDARVDVDMVADASVVARPEGGAPEGAMSSGPSDGEEDPFYTRWYVIAGAGGVVVLTTVIIIAAASSGGGDVSNAIAVPAIE